jgi:BirA family transcriptional regulator, biotin operon repressor / biotin---[acetyl-CoA-carboxylase] ligase
MNAHLFSGLKRLSHQTFRSGPAIAAELGISRATLSNSLKETDQFGVTVYKVHGRGYRLEQPLDWLAYGQIIEALGPMAKFFDVEIVDTSPSTNTVLMERAALGAASGRVLAAEFQSDGRGRRGRRWFAPLCGGVTFSLLWRFNQGAAQLSCLSLAVGVAVARTLRELGLHDVQLKWPNDILHRFHKLGGILIELSGDVLGPTFAVIGIGINVRLDQSSITKIDQAITDLAHVLESPPSRSVLLGKLLAHLGQVLPQFETEGFAPFRNEWLAFHAYQNRTVKMLLPRNTIEEGIVSGVADDGSLLLNRLGSVTRYTVGEISLTAAP